MIRILEDPTPPPILPRNINITMLPFDFRMYLSMSMNDSSNEFIEPPSIELMLLHHVSIILLTVIGNLLLIYVILKNNRVVRRKRVTPVQMLMLHMCAADLLFALITMVPTMGITLTVPVFYGPDALCKLVKFIQVLPMYASSFLLVAISADRYQAICHPLASMRYSAYNRPSLYAGLAWSAAFLFSSPQLALFHKQDGDCIGAYTSPNQYTFYVIVFNTVVWLLPSAIAGTLYLCVCRAVWQSGTSTRSVKKNERKVGPDMLLKPSPSRMQIHQKGSNIQCLELDRRRIQTVKLTLTIVAANFLLWAPFCVTSVIDALWPYAINPTMATYIMFFGNLNSCMNPWIWFHFNRTQIKRALTCYSSNEPMLRSQHTYTPMSSIKLMLYYPGHYVANLPLTKISTVSMDHHSAFRLNA